MHPSANVPPQRVEPVVAAGRAFALAMVAVLAAPVCIHGQTPGDGVACDGFVVVSAELSRKEAEEYCKYATRERQKVVRFLRPLASVIPDVPAYLLAGSFVKYLVDRKGGLDKFRARYASGDYQATYGVPFSTLEREWRAHLPRR